MTTANHDAHADAHDHARANDYDGFAEAYANLSETSFLNAYYERPAMLSLAGDVSGRRILDAGCGPGPLSAALRERGALVSGFDRSAGMVELARRRLGEGADIRIADLSDPLPFDAGTFDDVVASLVLHYLEDWGPTLTEIRRVLRPGGRLLASVQHPFVDYVIQDPRPDYHATTSYTADWTLFPDDFASLSTQMCFLFFVLEAPGEVPGA
ncbi:class I SAM-dependent methyltransferase [Streptomyces sp. NPDC046909]|uniref:class I SAM-dependent methyltransferase n=1 Tax=Streptomyces sp. NPDC046909 TaxID=3155617 RepID=UPI0033F67682